MQPEDLRGPVPASGSPVEATELSDREREILVLVAGGASNKEVAQRLDISPNTVKVHLRNIFGKIGVSSRTEAALFAVRAGLVTIAGETSDVADGEPDGTASAKVELPVSEVRAPPAPISPPSPKPRFARLWLTVFAVVVVVIGTLLSVPQWRQALWPGLGIAASPTAAPTGPPRWQTRAALEPTRSRLAVVTHESFIYAIGGESASGISGANERYNPLEDVWTPLAPKPMPVADVAAAVVGGLIYVPGGRLSSGAVTGLLEVYDPVADEWETRQPMPAALSAYALASFEGRLYVFGGWNGADYVATVYEYDPVTDVWTERTRLPTARGFAAATTAAGRIYVIGGVDARGATPAVEAYTPARDTEVANPWQTLPAMPVELDAVAAATIADTLYITGRNAADGEFAAWEFRPEAEEWRPLDLAGNSHTAASWLTSAAFQTHVYVLIDPPTDSGNSQLISYQALYTSLVPVISGDSAP